MKITLFFLCLVSFSARGQVGIGTNSPGANAALDITSTNKGLLLPRLNDTINVANPSEGLMIYDRQISAPAFHDGTKWNTIASRTSSVGTEGDSITYTITNPGTGYTGGTYSSILSLSSGLTNTYGYNSGIFVGGRATFQDMMLTKELDANSVSFTRGLVTGNAYTTMIIEFKVFTPGAANPNYSIKLTTPYITSAGVSIEQGGKYVEKISVNGLIYGYKNWITGATFAWNIQNNAATTY